MDKKQKTLRIFKYIGLILYILITAFLIASLAAVLADRAADKDLWELGGALLMIITLIASIGYIVPVTLGIIGAVISSKIQNRKSKRNCIIMIIAPLVTAIANFATYLIILK